MDHFVVYGGTFDLCLDNLTKVLHRCEEVDFSPNFGEVPFHDTRGWVLGQVVSQRGMKVIKAKIEVIKCSPPPTCVKGVRSFLGHAGFYWCFMKDFSKNR